MTTDRLHTGHVASLSVCGRSIPVIQ
jgi:hypothetical protein